MKKAIPGIIGVLLFIAVIVAWQALFIVDETQQAIVLQFGDPVATINTPGLAVKIPFIQNVLYFDKRILSSDAPPQELISASFPATHPLRNT
jgi:membrane protease subunit HflC